MLSMSVFPNCLFHLDFQDHKKSGEQLQILRFLLNVMSVVTPCSKHLCCKIVLLTVCILLSVAKVVCTDVRSLVCF
jgi:hypothetical protein